MRLFTLILCVVGVYSIETISVLATSSNKAGLLHFAGFMGSLMKNEAAERLDVHLILDKLHLNILHSCIVNINNSFHSFSVYDLETLDHTQSGMVLRKKTGDTKAFDSSIYKLDVVNVIPHSSNIMKVITLDIDLLILEDLGNLWDEPLKNPSKVLYMANESYSDDGYYTKSSTKKHFPHPYGYSSGVMVIDLKLLRELQLNGEKFLSINDEPTAKADQDVFNTWAYYNPNQVGELSCRWNRRIGGPCWEKNLFTNTKNSNKGIVHGKDGIFQGNADWTLKEYEEEKKAHREFSKVFFEACHNQNLRRWR